MIIRVICIGKTEQGFVKEGLDVYLARLKHYCKVDWLELDIKKAIVKHQEIDVVRKLEQAQIEKNLNGRNALWILDEKGKEFSSEGLARVIEGQGQNKPGIDLVIGGAYGFDELWRKKADMVISLSKLTFTHQMVRLILAEQLYRAHTILRGEGYHHA
jgi:23S rRNA (pseudouridine1915-N3)-methyltransferase